MNAVCKTKDKSTVLKLIKLFSTGVQINNLDTTIHVHGNGTVKKINGRWWEPSFSLLE